MKNLSFRAKITIWFSGIMAFLVAVTFAIVFWVSNAVVQKDIQDNLVEMTEANADELTYYEQMPELQELYKSQFIIWGDGYLEIDDDFLDVVNGIYTFLCDESGSLLYGENPLARAEMEIPFQNGTVQRLKWNKTVYYVYDRLLVEDGVEGLWLRGIVSEHQGTQQLSWLVRLCTIALPALLVLAVLGGYWIAGNALKPVKQITQAAAQISQGHDLNRRIGLGEGTDELHRLAAVLDDMIARLYHSFQAEQQFTSDVSHELRTPMSVIMAQCEYILEEKRTPEEYEEALESIRRQGKKMSRLIEDMLCFARLEQEGESYPKEQLPLSELVKDVCLDLSLYKRKNISLAWEIEPEIFFYGNATLLARMLSNLIINAYQYGKTDGSIRVTLSRGEKTVLLSVLDDGIGIAKEQQEKIFERFYRAEAARSGEGTGLGLAMVKDIAKYHGGTVAVISEEGKGSEFRLIFPFENDVF